MASSLQLYPPSLPPTLAQGHGFTPLANGRQRKRDAGEMRVRPRYRSTPEHATVVWVYDQTQFDVFDAWFENDLLVGSQVFDVQLHQRGGVLAALWYAARFVDEYQVQELEGLRYQVTATLLLLEELGPVRITPGIELSAPGWAWAGRAAMPAATIALAGVGVRWQGGVLLGAAYMEVAGTGVQTAGEIAMPAPLVVLAGAGVQWTGQLELPAPLIELGGLGVQFAGGVEA